MKATLKGPEPCCSPHLKTISVGRDEVTSTAIVFKLPFVFGGHTLEHVQVKAAPGCQKYPEASAHSVTNAMSNPLTTHPHSILMTPHTQSDCTTIHFFFFLNRHYHLCYI